MSLYENIISIKQKIKELCIIENKNEKDITIIAASKTVPIEILNTLNGYGISICGENRVQELLQKYGAVNTQWHFIGRLQTNKVKYIIDKVTLLHSLDKIELAEEIEKQCVKSGIKFKALIEINIAGEENKGGIPLEKAVDFYKELKKYPHIEICGLMSVMPEISGEKVNEKYYLQMQEIYGKIKNNAESCFKYLSMGMSGDYLTAIKYGANMIRIGRALFGERNYT